MEGLKSSARLLFRSALGIFLVTIVIGILNGIDVWDPPRNLLLTHVHAGTLGWITLSVVGASLLVFGENADAKSTAGGKRVAQLAVVAVVLYVIAFIIGTGIYRPIAGTLMLVAVVWVLAWAWRHYGALAKSSARLALLLALISLTIGAVLGVLLGLFLAQGSVPGLSEETASAVAMAHPPAMLIGYLILAGVAIADWRLDGGNSRVARIVAWTLFVAGLMVNVALIAESEPLVQAASALQVIAIIMFIVAMWSKVRPSAWAGGGATNFARLAVVGLVVGIALLVYVVQLFTSGELNPETGTGPIGVITAFDHAMFIGVMTNALLATLAGTWLVLPTQRLVMWAVNVGLVGFLLGLTVDSAILKRISTPIMGIGLLIAIWGYLTAPPSAAQTA
ncbi:MAG: hypothetical protein ACT4OP_05835 [Actinomycetota bacterium]